MPVKTAILALVRSIAQYPEDVVVKEMRQFSNGFEVRVSPRDVDLVISKLGFIRALAASFAGMTDGRKPFIYIANCCSPMFTEE